MSSVSGFQFSDPILTKVIYEINEEFNAKGPNESVEIPIAFKVIRDKLKENSTDLSLECTIGGRDGRFPFYLVVAMQSCFYWQEDYTSELLEGLLTQNAPALLLGYLRPTIAQITVASPFPPVHIPLVDFTKVPQID